MASTKFGHCVGWIKSSNVSLKKIAKSFLFLLLNRLANLLGLELLEL